MQKQYRLGIPSFITVETEDGSWIGEKNAQKTEKDDGGGAAEGVYSSGTWVYLG